MAANDTPLFCARCARELVPGQGNFFVVKIEAAADPGPMVVSDRDLASDPRRAIEELIRQMQDLSQQEMMDQVFRRLIIYLCTRCYREWIENPAG